MRPLWSKGAARTERFSGFAPLDVLRHFLCGREFDSGQVIPGGDDNPLFGLAERTGIGIDPDAFSAEEGLIYSAGFLAFSKGVCFYGEAVLPNSAAGDAFSGIDVLAFGGEGRRVAFTEVPPVAWPSCEATGHNARSFILLTTPAFFSAGWKPAVLAGRMVGAAVPGNMPISGWDLARGGPKPTRFAAPAGSIYFLNEQLEGAFDNISDSEEDRLAGYGCCLKGVWNDGK